MFTIRQPPSDPARFGSVSGFLGLFLSVALAGCGDAPAPPGADGTTTVAVGSEDVLDPCTLVTPAEAAQALGASIETVERPGPGNIPPRLLSCRYVAPRGEGIAVMTVLVRLGESETAARLGFEAVRDEFPAAEPIPDLGEDAFALMNQVNVLRGPVHLVVHGDFDGRTARTIAGMALERLP